MDLPEGWEWWPLKHTTTFLNRGSAPDYVDDGPVRAISQAANQLDGLNWERTRFHDFHGDARKLKGHLQYRDVLINSTGTGTLGRVGFFESAPDERPCMADGHVTVVRLNEEVIDARFAYYWLSSQPFQDLVYAALIVGATNQIELNRERLASAPVPVPPLREQQRIADFLDLEIARIAKMEFLQRVVLARVGERDQAFLDLELDRLVDKFGVILFRRVIRRIEQGASPQCDGIPAEGGEWGVLKLSSVKRGVFWPKENKRLPEETAPERRYAVKNGDLLVTRANTPDLVGDVAVVTQTPSRLLLPDLIYRIELSKRLLPDFSSMVLRGSRVRELVRATARGTSQSMVKLRGEDIREWPIPNADLISQREVVERVAKQQAVTNLLRSQISRQLELLAERRQALITAAVTGRIDVATARGVVG